MKKTKWQEIWARTYSPLVGVSYFLTFQKPDPKWHVSKNKLFVPKGNLHGFFLKASESEKLVNKFKQYLLSHDVQKFSETFEHVFKKEYAFWKKFIKNDITKKTNKQLSNDCLLVDRRFIVFGEWQFLAFIALMGPVADLEVIIRDRESLEAISTLKKETKINKARLDFLKLCAKGRPNKTQLENYCKKYAWLPVYDFKDKPLDVRSLRKQIVSPQKAKVEIAAYNYHKRAGLKKYTALLKSEKNPKTKKLMEISHSFAYLKEMRDDYRRPAYLMLQPFFREVAKRAGLTFEEINYLTPQEASEAVLHPDKKYKSLAKNRIKCFALELKNGKLIIHHTKRKILELVKETQPAEKNNLVSGTPAYSGTVKGKAKIIYHKGEFGKFKQNEILVTVMTHPEFLPIMRKAKAIITDEGGLTCHAAIVAREMKKPCVIGTKIATKVFKDGDIIEIDANKGVVRKIK